MQTLLDDGADRLFKGLISGTVRAVPFVFSLKANDVIMTTGSDTTRDSKALEPKLVLVFMNCLSGADG